MKDLICTICPKGCHLHVDENNNYEVTGNSCLRGKEYGQKELINPTRIIPSTVKIKGGIHKRLPVKTDKPIPKSLIFKAIKLLDNVDVDSPIKAGDIIISNILGTDINFIASRDM